MLARDLWRLVYVVVHAVYVERTWWYLLPTSMYRREVTCNPPRWCGGLRCAATLAPPHTCGGASGRCWRRLPVHRPGVSPSCGRCGFALVVAMAQQGKQLTSCRQHSAKWLSCAGCCFEGNPNECRGHLVATVRFLVTGNSASVKHCMHVREPVFKQCLR